ncbi:sigma-54-dependent Fis family transcriptional regulator, partial [Candidatus Saccharibacteria bacterium]|nr:sigma-54-dependent Fis family transcriptional regulator [Candidatus Saccharibacteria bacterium]NIV03791.1 sigma-54-dependent Fis family transcriptional regulator [Calditrichia bacterium]NIV71815.1 sigma-54-dependent Fis family transcriptional regulator [Calditrichia bacterium]NIV98963.1 sigma-54-dependent Fis family transcriptional regulator [Candidatus Saccharibacteria bacterium]NIW78655.1 sigma-54-dependent Fis family transcriptional regulator [Calditrichia bacterium]
QIKLLRALEEGEIMPVGSSRIIPIDVRLIAACNQDIIEAIARNQFREDLYYRLNVFNIDIPPLRERQEDIPLLLEYYIQHFNREMHKNIHGV